MKRTLMAALVAALAIGCAESPPAETASEGETDLQITIPEPSEGDSSDAGESGDTTMVSLKVPGMT